MEHIVKDAVAKLTPLGAMVLGLLREGDMHPYEMIRLFRQRHEDRMLTITNGTLYHTVARLERLGLIAEVGIDRDGNRPERTTYTLTTDGRDAAVDWVRQELPRIDRPTEFRVALSEAHGLHRDEVIDLMTGRRAALAADHAVHHWGLEKARDRAVPEQFLIEVSRQEAILAAELAWTDAFLERLESPEYLWGVSDLPDHVSEDYLAERKAAQL
jgi:DNA-binding PadR family transcriptional regulator